MTQTATPALSDTAGMRLYPTACSFLWVGRPVSLTRDGRPIAWHHTWHIYGRGVDDLGQPHGEHTGPIGRGYDTRAEARLHAEQVTCPTWHSGA